jgi:hypothetical protein
MNKKLPIGIMPRQIHDESRLYDLASAIYRYLAVERKIPIAWIEEYNELIERCRP